MATKSGKYVYLQAVIMINQPKGWMKLRTAISVCPDLVSNQVELAWLTHYPPPGKVIVDRGYN